MSSGAATTFPQTPHPTTVEGERGLLLLTSGAAAEPALRELIQEGANAMDLALAAALAQVVHCAGSWSSLAGILGAVYFDASSGEICTLDAGFDRPRGETTPESIPGIGTPSGRATLVPGFMAGTEAAHKRFGLLPWERLFEPAIALATHGVTVDKTLDALITFRADVLKQSSGARAVFSSPDGQLPRAGSRLLQPALAATLRAVASEGAKHMYAGTWAQHFVAAVKSAGGMLSMEDLTQYQARWTAPVRTTYRGFEVAAIGPPQQGGICLVEALNVLAAADWAELGHYTRSSQALLWLIRTSHLCYAGYLYDGIPLERRAEPGWARMLWSGLKQHRGLRLAERFGRRLPADRRHHTDAIVAIDASGNIAIVSHSINTTAWGTTGLFVDGVSIPDSAAFQQPILSRVAPGGRVPNALNPTLLLKDGRPFCAMAAIGGSIAETMLQAAVNLVDFGMMPAQVANTPFFLQSVWPALRLFQRLVIGCGIVLFAIAITVSLALMATGASAWAAAASLCIMIAAFLNGAFIVSLLIAVARNRIALLEFFDAPGIIVATGVTGVTISVIAYYAGGLDGYIAIFYATVGMAAVVLVPTLRASLYPVTLVERGDFDAKLLKSVRREGQPVKVITREPPRGFWIGAAFDPNTRQWCGAVSPRLWDGIASALESKRSIES